jgi:hypothetical protein
MIAVLFFAAFVAAGPAQRPLDVEHPLSGPVAAAIPSAAAPAVATSQDTTGHRVFGRVLSEDSGQPLPFAVVELGAGAALRTVTSDEQGRYRLDGVPAGAQRIRVSTLDHAPLALTVHIPRSGDLELDLILRLTPIGIAGVTVISNPPQPSIMGGSGGEAPGRGTPADPELRALDATPGVAELGLVEGARAEPGVDPGDPAGALYVRGAASDLKLVLLDGAPVYAPFHLGGLLEAFQPNVLQSAWLYSGGAPVRYDGGLSYILDLSTRPGRLDALHSGGAIDLLGAGGLFEGPIGIGSILASGRAIHHAGSDGVTGEPLPYGYADGLVRLDIGLGAAHRVSATGFVNRESVELDPVTGLNRPAYWGNAAGSLRYSGRWAGTQAHVTAALSRFVTKLPVGVQVPGIADGESWRTRVAADFARPLGGLRLGYGALYDRQEIEYQAWEATDTGTVWLARQGISEALGAYGEVIWEPQPVLQVRAGLRTNAFLSASELHLAPRLSVGWQVSEHSNLSFAAGRYHQYLRVPETLLSGNLSDAWTDASLLGTEAGLQRRPFAVAGATHFSVGLDHTPSEELRLGMVAFYKSYDGTPEVTGLRSSGLDLWLDWQNGPWAAWAGYSLAWAWAQQERLGTADRFSARHLLSGGVRAPLPSGMRFAVRLSSSRGIPYTPIPTSAPGGVPASDQEAFDELVQRDQAREAISGAPAGSYLRIDATVSRSWSAHLLGADVELVPYLKVLNALDRRDALFYQFDAGQDLRPRSLDAVPLLPVIGIEWRQ